MAYSDYGNPNINPWTGLPWDTAQPGQPYANAGGTWQNPDGSPYSGSIEPWALQTPNNGGAYADAGGIWHNADGSPYSGSGDPWGDSPTFFTQTPDPTKPPTTPNTTTGGNTGGPGGSGGGNGNLFNLGQPGTLTAPFTTPFGGLPQLPNLTLPSFRQADPFRATTGADVEADPSYAWEKNQGITGVQQAAASKGLLNSGGTLKDISQWTTDYANTKLNDVNARRLQDYATNYQTQTLDPYRFAYQSALDAYSPLMSQYQNQSNLALPLWQQQFGVFKDQRDSTWSKAAQVLTS